MKIPVLLVPLFLPVVVTFAQVVDIRDAQGKPPAAPAVQIASALPVPVLGVVAPGQVSLLPGLFRERRELNKAYLLRLKPENLLQNHYLEAGIRIDKPWDEMHQGWESPSSQVRGIFLGHWMSAAARMSANDHDPELAARLSKVVAELARCQELNGGEWVGSIPEKYFTILSENKTWIWSPQYTLHKTMLGLYEADTVAGDHQALEVLEHSADWFYDWTSAQLKAGRSAAIYGGESCGMLELWANLYGVTHKARDLELATRYANPDIFEKLLAGGDPLTNAHANASIPWFQGAARLYEVTGDPRYRRIVERFWACAVTQRGMFATTGNNAGEFWIPPGQFGRFLGSHTQEHCTVYNMIRVAQYLLKWTGAARYADYIESALYNGILAQQNPQTGMVSYFLPLEPGAKKIWGSETHDFWCCHGTLVQAQALYEELIYYPAADGLTVNQYIPATGSFDVGGEKITVAQRFDQTAMAADLQSADATSHWVIALDVTSAAARRWTLRLRQPAWISGAPKVFVDDVEVPAVVSSSGYLELTREWKSSRVKVIFPKHLVGLPLPGDPGRVALLDGPVVLAGLTDKEQILFLGNAPAQVAATPIYEHQYSASGDWQWSHYLVRSRGESIPFKPLYEIADERYTVYFPTATP